MKKEYNVTINFGLSSAFAFVVIITTFCVSTVLFFNMRSVMREDLKKRIHDILAIGITKINADMHASLTSPEQESTAQYAALKKVLQEIRDGSTEVRYVYTIRHLGNHAYQFIVDAEEDAKDISHLGDEYTGFDIESQIGKDNTIYVCKEFEKDKWGTWLTGYAKIVNSNGASDSYLCIDISAHTILQRERYVLVDILLIGAIVASVFVMLGLVIARRIVKPLALLEQDMIRIKDFDLDAAVDIKSRFIEIINMKYAEDNMKLGLQSFKKYVPADLVSQLIRLNKEARLGGEKKELTVMFTDIANFTGMSEQISPELLSELMSEYFEGLTQIIIKHNGTVDKYIGDSIMSFWGAPSDIRDHVYLTCLAALECRQFLQTLNENYRQTGKPELITRFGINSGEVIVGNFGYKDRFNYTVIGDNVNLASRLEGINKVYGTTIIISENTYRFIEDRFVCRKIDIVAVKGKNTGIPIYELFASKENISEKQASFVDLFNQGMDLYLDRQWNQALEFFEKAQGLFPDDTPSALIIERCKEYMDSLPSADWQGITVMYEK